MQSLLVQSTDGDSDRVEPGDQFDPGGCGRPPHLSAAEQLMRRIMHYDGEFRREEAAGAIASRAKH